MGDEGEKGGGGSSIGKKNNEKKERNRKHKNNQFRIEGAMHTGRLLINHVSRFCQPSAIFPVSEQSRELLRKVLRMVTIYNW